MKAYIKAWQDIYNEKGLISEIEDLKKFNGILYSPVREIKELTLEVADQLVDDFRKSYPDFRYDHLEIKIIQDQSQSIS